MARWAAPVATEEPGVREMLLRDYRAKLRRIADESVHGEEYVDRARRGAITYYSRYLEAIEAGAALVLPGWKLRKPWRFCRVEPDGQVVRVEPRYRLDDAKSVWEWDEVTA